MEILSVEGARLIDKYAMEELQIPGIVLMENVSSKIVDRISSKGLKYLIFVGCGNNGGDGLAVGRKLIIQGKLVEFYIVGNKANKSKEFITNYNILKSMGATFKEIESFEDINKEMINSIITADIVVDGMLGIGLNRTINKDSILYKVIEVINNYSRYTISIDIPTGINANTGKVLGVAIKAKETYTVEVIKKGFLNYEAFEYIGKLEIIPLEIPSKVLKKYSEKIYMLDKKDYKDIMPIRKIFGHKGDYGKVVILAGSEGYVGASYLTTYATIKTGSGLVTTIVQDNIKDIFMAKITEGMVIPYSNLNQIEESIRKADVIACGPGLGKTSISEEMFKEIISQSTCLVVIDADGLNFISKDNSLKEYIKGRAIFTPHLGEMARLTGESIEEIKENRIEISKKYAKENNIVLVLKGFNTIITDGEKVYINNTGNSKMASGGMGDTLTGIIASLVGQGLKTLEGALLGCYIHGRAGETASLDRYSVTASEVITEIPKIMEELSIN